VRGEPPPPRADSDGLHMAAAESGWLLTMAGRHRRRTELAHTRKPPPPARNTVLDARLNPIAEREIGDAEDALRHLDRAVTALRSSRRCGPRLDLAAPGRI